MDTDTVMTEEGPLTLEQVKTKLAKGLARQSNEDDYDGELTPVDGPVLPGGRFIARKWSEKDEGVIAVICTPIETLSVVDYDCDDPDSSKFMDFVRDMGNRGAIGMAFTPNGAHFYFDGVPPEAGDLLYRSLCLGRGFFPERLFNKDGSCRSLPMFLRANQDGNSRPLPLFDPEPFSAPENEKVTEHGLSWVIAQRTCIEKGYNNPVADINP